MAVLNVIQKSTSPKNRGEEDFQNLNLLETVVDLEQLPLKTFWYFLEQKNSFKGTENILRQNKSDDKVFNTCMLMVENNVHIDDNVRLFNLIRE
ncbi:hypothetical protein RhiirA1_543744 [Rhizophagus irregularis]|uniref:Uncharacterized protein n=1 Tax=Rhizophagus irregularis TaxID=588596 RepID=A0A2N0QJI8_9GLOM|nr:hypothetical protein RhiirA1_543744 [Rhizophagus irregularis]